MIIHVLNHDYYIQSYKQTRSTGLVAIFKGSANIVYDLVDENKDAKWPYVFFKKPVDIYHEAILQTLVEMDQVEFIDDSDMVVFKNQLMEESKPVFYCV